MNHGYAKYGNKYYLGANEESSLLSTTTWSEIIKTSANGLYIWKKSIPTTTSCPPKQLMLYL
ncbi:hypothetical protein BGZ76_002003, partial [Entomortierella beljakovae]